MLLCKKENWNCLGKGMFVFSKPLKGIVPSCPLLVNVFGRKLDGPVGKENGRQEVSGLLFTFVTHPYKLPWCKASSVFYFLFLHVCLFFNDYDERVSVGLCHKGAKKLDRSEHMVFEVTKCSFPNKHQVRIGTSVILALLGKGWGRRWGGMGWGMGVVRRSRTGELHSLASEHTGSVLCNANRFGGFLKKSQISGKLHNWK